MTTYELPFDIGYKVKDEFSGIEYTVDTITIEKGRVYYIGKGEGKKVSIGQVAKHLEFIDSNKEGN